MSERVKTGGNLARHFKAPPRARRGARDVPQDRLYEDIQRGIAYFWSKRGGRPTTGTFGDTFKFNTSKTA